MSVPNFSDLMPWMREFLETYRNANNTSICKRMESSWILLVSVGVWARQDLASLTISSLDPRLDPVFHQVPMRCRGSWSSIMDTGSLASTSLDSCYSCGHLKSLRHKAQRFCVDKIDEWLNILNNGRFVDELFQVVLLQVLAEKHDMPFFAQHWEKNFSLI